MGEQKILEEELDPDYEPTEAEVLEYAEWLGIDPEGEKELLWISRHGLVAKLPAYWKPCQNENGQLYYFNFESGQSVWEHPCDTASKELFENERTRLIHARATGGSYSPRECSRSNSEGVSKPASSNGQPATSSQKANLSQAHSTSTTTNVPLPECQGICDTHVREATKFEQHLMAERPLTAMPVLPSPENGAMLNGQLDGLVSHAEEHSGPCDVVTSMPDTESLPSGPATQLGKDYEASRAAAEYHKELQSIEEEFQLKLQARKAALEQAEEDLLDADKHARLQLVERQKQHQAEMRALHKNCKEELEKSRAELEQENAVALAQMRTEMEDKLAQMQADMKQQLEEARKGGADHPRPQGNQSGMYQEHEDTASRLGAGHGDQEEYKVHSTHHLPNDIIAEQSRLLQPISLENSENFPPVVVEDSAARPCVQGNSQGRVKCQDGDAPQKKSAAAAPATCKHADKEVTPRSKTSKQQKQCRAPFPEAHDTFDEGNEQLMKKQTCTFLKQQKRLIRRRQAAMHRAREEWQRNAEILDDVYPDNERAELVRVLTQVHQTLEDQAKHLNQDSEQLAVMKERLASGSFPVSSPPALLKSRNVKAGSLERGDVLTRSVNRTGSMDIAAFSNISTDQACLTAIQDKRAWHLADVDVENLLESHAHWLRSLREKITKVSRPGGRAISSSGRHIGFCSLRGTQSTPVNVRVGHDRELVIRVQSSAVNSP